MREYLFRGKRKDNGEWVEGFLVKKADPLLGVWSCFILVQGFDTSCIDGRQTILKSEMTWYKVDPETVGQYTGLTDKNGKKIFEGDIVVSTNANRLSNKPYIVEFSAISGYWCCDPKREPVVIGNIHDNKEILKEGGKE